MQRFAWLPGVEVRAAFAGARSGFSHGKKDVGLGGGANVAQQFLAAGLVDEMLISLVAIPLGGGERLFDRVGADLHGLELVRTVPAPGVVHLIFARR